MVGCVDKIVGTVIELGVNKIISIVSRMSSIVRCTGTCDLEIAHTCYVISRLRTCYVILGI